MTFPRLDGTRPEEDDIDDDDDDDERVSAPPPRRMKVAGPVRKKKNVDRGRNKVNRPIWSLLGGTGGLALTVVLIYGAAIIYKVTKGLREIGKNLRESNPVASLASRGDIPEEGPATVPYPIERYPLPSFPELGAGQPIEDTNIVVRSITLKPPAEKAMLPSFAMQMRIYVPAGNHAPGSLPLVLVAPAGTPLIVGNGLESPHYHAETLPYAKAGAVAILFSLDGGLVDIQKATGSELSAAYNKFRAAGAGTVNARTALEFALAKIPIVDPKRIVIAGHSSAATLSMLFAAHEPRLAAAIAYSPCTDVPNRLQQFVTEMKKQRGFPELSTFVEKSSPQRHAKLVRCPTFLFHPTDDANCSYIETQTFVNLLKSFGKDTVLSEPPVEGGHYQPMITEGIPRAIRWLRDRGILASD